MPHSLTAFIEKLQRRTAQAAIGPSALRKQGAAGVIAAARNAAKATDLSQYANCNAESFPAFLDSGTQIMVSTFPPEAQNWGAARKAMNLFLRDAVYNRDLFEHFGLAAIRSWLEVPLDRDVATSLRREPEGQRLPRWRSIKGLTPAVSAEFQEVACIVAKRFGVARVDLDVYYWRPKTNAQT